MNKTFCERCGLELGPYEIWRVSVSYSNDPYPKRHGVDSGPLCEKCVAPAGQIIADVASGDHRALRFKKAAA